MSNTLELSLSLDPRVIVPTSGPRDVDKDWIQALVDDPSLVKSHIICVEVGGFLLMVDGHHQWAAHLIKNPSKEIYVRITTRENALRLGFHTPNPAEIPSLRKIVFDWESILNVRLAAPDRDEGKFPLVVVCGPSGVGKTALLYDVRARLTKDPFVRSATSRAMRSHEKDGVDYDFYTADQFEALIADQHFAEWQYVHGNFYGSVWSYLFGGEFEERPRTTDLDIYGAIQLKSLFPRGVCSVFVDADSISTIRDRLMDRASENLEISTRRLSRAQRERQYRSLFDRTVLNNEFKKASQDLQRLLEIKSQSYSNFTFFEDPEIVATYVCLSISNGKGDLLVWKNSQKYFPPSICIGANDTALVFRLLEDMVIDQLCDEVRKRGGDDSFILEMSSELEKASPIKISSCGVSPSLTVFTKKVEIPKLDEFMSRKPLIFGFIEAARTPWKDFI